MEVEAVKAEETPEPTKDAIEVKKVEDVTSIPDKEDEIITVESTPSTNGTSTQETYETGDLFSQTSSSIPSTDTDVAIVSVFNSQEELALLKDDEEMGDATDIESTLIAVAADEEKKDTKMLPEEVDPEDDCNEIDQDVTQTIAEQIYERCVQEEKEKMKNLEEDLKEGTEDSEVEVGTSQNTQEVPEVKLEPKECKTIDIVELDDTDEDDLEGSDDEDYSEDDSEEHEYGDYDDEDVEMIEQEHVQSAKRHEYEQSTKPTKKIPHYKSSTLNRMFVQQMKRRSVRMLNCRRYSLKKKIMQIMDDAGETNECETQIPNNGSPDIVKTSKAPVSEEQNDEKENTDPLESNHATESLVSSEESKEIVENESKSFDDEEEEESISKNDDSIQMIDSDDDATNESEVVTVKKEEKPEPKKEVSETVLSKENQEKDLKKVEIEDVGSDEAADAKQVLPEINEENLYDDIENELQPHVVNCKVSVDQITEKPKEDEPMDVSRAKETKVTSLSVPETEPTVKKEVVHEVVVTTKETTKRRRTPSPIPCPNSSMPIIQPSKKLRLELENSYGRHDKLLREYIEATGRSKSVDDVKQSICVLDTEIKSLDAMLRAKEDEWNNILHMKLVKEEIRMRLVRRKETLEIKVTDPNVIETGTNVSFQSSTPITSKTQSHPLSAAFNAPLLQESLKSGRHVTNSAQNLSQTMLPLTSSMGSSTQSILHQRANMKGTDLMKEKQAAAKIQRNILPRPTTLPNHEQILRNLAMSSATSTAFQQQQLNELFNGHSKISMGRQGPTKDVSSIIADFREKNPDVPPRRGRRVKGNSVDLFLQLLEQNSRPSSADSSHSNSNAPAMGSNAPFKDILAQFAKMTPAERQLYSSNNSIISALNMTTQAASQGNSSASNNNNNNKPPPYPEVTLHPVMNSSDNGSSLLHGILTKTQNRSSSSNQPSAASAAAAASNFTNYSPTLARLLTSPERISSQNLPNYTQASNNALAGLTASGLNLSNKNSEITITPVVSSQSLQQTLLQQKFQMDDDNDDNSTDRLVIDEGDNQQSSLIGRNATDEIQENEVPECQGCRKREAQFVCAGCGNQWYCSRECQVQAWDEHSENCSG